MDPITGKFCILLQMNFWIISYIHTTWQQLLPKSVILWAESPSERQVILLKILFILLRNYSISGVEKYLYTGCMWF